MRERRGGIIWHTRGSGKSIVMVELARWILEDGPRRTTGEVFVDECHRTQNGRLHRVMKAGMANAVFIGFTGTPLPRSDSKTTLET